MSLARGISVVVCTFNRADRLRLTLEHLLACERPPLWGAEIVVVDNNSTDGTKRVIDAIAENSPIQLSYVFEQRQGLGHARNAGIRYAGGDIVSMVDDDTIPDPQFFYAVKQAFETHNCEGIIGGRVELWDPTDLPLTIKTERTKQLLYRESHPSGFILGCNMSVHRSVFQAIGGFDRRFDAGTPTKSAGDLDFYYRAQLYGFPVIYCPDIVVYHNHGRKTPTEAEELTAGYQIGRGAFYAKHILAGDRRIQRYTYWDYYNGLRALVTRPFSLRKAKAELRVLSNYSRGAFRFLRTRSTAGIKPEEIGI